MNYTQAQINQFNDYYRTHTIKETAEFFNLKPTTIRHYLKSKRIKLSNKERKHRRVLAVSKRRKKVKQLLVEYKGGKCSLCSYNKCLGALQFHHKDPIKKSFGLSVKGLTRGIDKLKEEADKCVLLCANCHAETHNC